MILERSQRPLFITLVMSLLAVSGSGLVSPGQVANKQQPPTLGQQEQFKLIAVGDSTDPECKGDPLSMRLTGRTVPPECVLLGWRLYEAIDGSRAKLTHGKFDSPDIATQRLQFWMKSAKKIIRKENRKDALGNVIGQRVVASLESGNGNQEHFQVGWTYIANCYLISSPSLSTALSLEEWTSTPVAIRR